MDNLLAELHCRWLSYNLYTGVQKKVNYKYKVGQKNWTIFDR